MTMGVAACAADADTSSKNNQAITRVSFMNKRLGSLGVAAIVPQQIGSYEAARVTPWAMSWSMLCSS
jgi:hypothetical protein